MKSVFKNEKETSNGEQISWMPKRGNENIAKTVEADTEKKEIVMEVVRKEL